MIRPPETLLKLKIRGAGISQRDIAIALGEELGTISNRLNGYSPLPNEMRKRIEKICEERFIELEKADRQ